ncbi:unnamed protein product [Ceratitis capitata]|uniref:(Mediterranean fruit fly) hypothetical protein n=1 Tax=Ceratitis capitata TaxID=7213 RepID=A0A811UB42_CERCA|nr:unnamed protein product [Ceratitis capitata]
MLEKNLKITDLQSEIETHRVVYDRLDGTGRKLLGSLTSQEDAVMLQRRLDEMNQRWNNLKSKSIAISVKLSARDASLPKPNHSTNQETTAISNLHNNQQSEVDISAVLNAHHDCFGIGDDC